LITALLNAEIQLAESSKQHQWFRFRRQTPCSGCPTNPWLLVTAV